MKKLHKILIIILLQTLISLLVLFLSNKYAYSCTDVLSAFLSVEKLNEKVKNSLLKINDAFQRLDVALTQNNEILAQQYMDILIDTFFDFYLNYYQNPPAQFVDDPKWTNKLTEVNLKIKEVKDAIQVRDFNDAHKKIQIAYNTFSAIYIDRVPMQEHNVLELIKQRIESMEIEILKYKPNDTYEAAIHANNIKSLADRLNLFDALNEDYKKEREKLVTLLYNNSDIIITKPPTNSIECNILIEKTKQLNESVEIFIKKRKEILNQKWFEKK